ncbi:MAG: UTP--glucose-1-phosphate uridylyltransferase GalU [Clostridia bacterium]|nr:UTP--glucose-1-phosphate uridylyltransferase GalU [Clostridia bacterium]
MNIRKVVIPVAGWGTRSLPASKNIPKEMLPIFNKPVIQYIVEEAMSSGIKDVIFVTNRDKSAIEDHFDYNLQLESVLERSGKKELLETVHQVAEMVNIMSVRQKKQLGLGHAVLCAEHIVAGEPFAVMVGDDLIINEDPGLHQLIAVAEREKKSVIGVIKVANELVSRYGIVDGVEREDGIIEVKSLVEKPATEEAPSNIAIIGRYVLMPEIFDCLRSQKPGKGGEIQLTDALDALCREQGMLAVPLQGTRFDAGNWIDYLAANIFFGIQDASVRPGLLQRLDEILSD